MWTFRWYFVHPRCCVTITSFLFQNISITWRGNPAPITPHFYPTPSHEACYFFLLWTNLLIRKLGFLLPQVVGRNKVGKMCTLSRTLHFTYLTKVGSLLHFPFSLVILVSEMSDSTALKRREKALQILPLGIKNISPCFERVTDINKISKNQYWTSTFTLKLFWILDL